MGGNNRITVKQETYDRLKRTADKKKISISILADTILKEFIFEEKEHKIILTIPYELTKGNQEGFSNWLKERMEAVMNIYYKDKVKNVVSSSSQ